MRSDLRAKLEGEEPLTVGAVSEKSGLTIPPQQEMCDVIELRLDGLLRPDSGISLADVLAYVQTCPLPLLITARGSEEGGMQDWDVARRAEAYRALLPHVASIDVEMRDFGPLAEILDEARALDIIIVGSYHDFDATPPLDDLLAKLATPADVHKFALQTNSWSDLSVHLSLLDEREKARPLSVMGMGPLGGAARPLLAKAGSCLNYGFIGSQATAPGQWPASLLKETLTL